MRSIAIAHQMVRDPVTVRVAWLAVGHPVAVGVLVLLVQDAWIENAPDNLTVLISHYSDRLCERRQRCRAQAERTVVVVVGVPLVEHSVIVRVLFAVEVAVAVHVLVCKRAKVNLVCPLTRHTTSCLLQHENQTHRGCRARRRSRGPPASRARCCLLKTYVSIEFNSNYKSISCLSIYLYRLGRRPHRP